MGVTRTLKYAELSTAEKIQADCDMKGTNIILQGFAVPVFSPRDDPIACLNKAVAFLTVIASSRKQNESCDKCLNLEAELLKSQNAHNDILKRCSQLEKHCISLESSIQLNQEIFQKDESCDNQNAPEIPIFFKKNDLKTQLQDKDTTMCKLKDIIKSMREKSKDENVNYDYVEVETKNVELENSVEKLILENERLCNEVNHVKLDLKAQIQDKVFVITSLKNDLRKIKRKEIVDIAAQKPSTNTIVPRMFKLDLVPLDLKLFQNREAHIDYLKYTQEQVVILWGIVEQAKAKQPLDNALDFDCNKKNDRMSQTPSRNMKNKVKAQPRNVNKQNRVVEPIRNVDVKKSQLNANSELVCATCEKSVFDGVHYMCLLDFVKNMNSRAKSAKTHKKTKYLETYGITSANVVPPKQTNSHSAETQKPELKVYNRKPKTVKNAGSSKKDKIVEYKNANHLEPNHTWGSNATIIQSSSSLVMTGCPDCSLVQLDSGTTILQGSWGMVTISWEMLLSQEYTTSRGLDITCFLL
nr:hypothetical protein [Tanacetum cinerariifolium]